MSEKAEALMARAELAIEYGLSEESPDVEILKSLVSLVREQAQDLAILHRNIDINLSSLESAEAQLRQQMKERDAGRRRLSHEQVQEEAGRDKCVGNTSIVSFGEECVEQPSLAGK